MKRTDHKRQAGDMRSSGRGDDKASVFAEGYFAEYLAKNRETARMLRDMAPAIDAFRAEAPEILLRKCMDGRTNTADHKGCPPTTVENQRSDGNKALVDANNTDFWLPIRTKMVRAETRTPGKPALFITAGHRSELSSSCAAYGKPNDRKQNTDRRALQGVLDQALDVENTFLGTPDADKLYCLTAMTNTDTGAMALYVPGGERLTDANEVILRNGWTTPTQVFSATFLAEEIGGGAHECIRGKTLQALFETYPAPAATDPRIKIALEAYLLKRFNSAQHESHELESLLSPAAFRIISDALAQADRLPASLRGFLSYLVAWNMAYALEQSRKITALSASDPLLLDRYVGHDERLIGFGNGFEAATKHNNMLLVKPGSGNDRQAIGVAKSVMQGVAAHRGLTQPPLVHINIELDSVIDTWHQLTSVVARMNTKMGIIRSIFSGDSPVRVLTTYSYNTGVRGAPINKLFFPVDVNPADACIVSPGGLRLSGPSTFDASRLREWEASLAGVG